MSVEAVRYITLEVALTEVITADRFVKIGASGVENCDTAGEDAIGIAQDASTNKSSRAITVIDIQGGGVAEVAAGAAVAVGASVQTNASGQAITATGSGHVLGTAKSAATAAGDIIQIFVGSVGKN